MFWKKNPGKNDIMTYALIAGGAYLAYWYITNYGPTGAVSAGSVSYWNTWFGASTSLPTTNTTQPQQVTVATNGSGTGTSTGTSGGTASGQSSTQQMATQDQLNAINVLLTPSDQRILASMPQLTYQQAQTMLANAQACMNGQSLNPASNACYTPKTGSPFNGSGPNANRNPTNTGGGASPGGVADTTANQLVLAAGGGNPMLSADQWNYYYTQLSHVTQTADLFPAGQPRTTPISVQQYLQARVADGLEIMLNGNANVAASGLTSSGRAGSTGVRGMGQIMPLSPFVTPAWNGVRNPNYLSNGLGAIVPLTPTVPATSGVGMGGLGNLSQAVKSPWGKLPVNPTIQ